MDYLKNYIEVKDRIQMFYDKYPNGVLRFQYRGVLEFNGETFIYGEAFAYPDREQLNHATGWAWERVPAKGFARGSELMVLETSAWGRAIAAVNAVVAMEVQSNAKLPVCKVL